MIITGVCFVLVMAQEFGELKHILASWSMIQLYNKKRPKTWFGVWTYMSFINLLKNYCTSTIYCIIYLQPNSIYDHSLYMSYLMVIINSRYCILCLMLCNVV
jgi:hypothetical protein